MTTLKAFAGSEHIFYSIIAETCQEGRGIFFCPPDFYKTLKISKFTFTQILKKLISKKLIFELPLNLSIGQFFITPEFIAKNSQYTDWYTLINNCKKLSTLHRESYQHSCKSYVPNGTRPDEKVEKTAELKNTAKRKKGLKKEISNISIISNKLSIKQSIISNKSNISNNIDNNKIANTKYNISNICNNNIFKSIDDDNDKYNYINNNDKYNYKNKNIMRLKNSVNAPREALTDRGGINTLLKDLNGSEEVLKAFWGFIAHVKELKLSISKVWVKSQINILNKIIDTDLKIKVIEDTEARGWRSLVYVYNDLTKNLLTTDFEKHKINERNPKF